MKCFKVLNKNKITGELSLNWLQRVRVLRAFWDLEKNVLHEIPVSGTLVSLLLTQKSPPLHIHKPKYVVVETVLVIFM